MVTNPRLYHSPVEDFNGHTIREALKSAAHLSDRHARMILDKVRHAVFCPDGFMALPVATAYLDVRRDQMYQELYNLEMGPVLKRQILRFEGSRINGVTPKALVMLAISMRRRNELCRAISKAAFDYLFLKEKNQNLRSPRFAVMASGVHGSDAILPSAIHPKAGRGFDLPREIPIVLKAGTQLRIVVI